MIDRPALAQAIIQAMKEWQREKYSVWIEGSLSFDVIARVLAEHETAHRAQGETLPFDDWASDLASSRESYGFDSYCALLEEGLRKAHRAGLEAAEARCAQLEAEHERRRAALERYGRHVGHCQASRGAPCTCGLSAVLAPSQEHATSPTSSRSPSPDHS
jgi:hypothetical protein